MGVRLIALDLDLQLPDIESLELHLFFILFYFTEGVLC